MITVQHPSLRFDLLHDGRYRVRDIYGFISVRADTVAEAESLFREDLFHLWALLERLRINGGFEEFERIAEQYEIMANLFPELADVFV